MVNGIYDALTKIRLTVLTQAVRLLAILVVETGMMRSTLAGTGTGVSLIFQTPQGAIL
jgi:hypothetical protein